jgi:hypothetical protein
MTMMQLDAIWFASSCIISAAAGYYGVFGMCQVERKT